MFSLKDKINPGHGDDESSWSVILILPSLDAKEAIAGLLTEAFRVTDEFAAQLLMSTPVILLDGLSQEEASRVRSYFQQGGAEACISQNREVKKICYRVKWRSQPDLSFLGGFNPAQKSEGAEKSSADRALLEKDAKLRQLETDRQLEKRIADEKVNQIMREMEEWKSKGTALRRDVQVLTEARDQMQKALTEAHQALEALQKGGAAKPLSTFSSLPEASLQAKTGDAGGETQKLRQEIVDLTRSKERLESSLLTTRAELEASEKRNRAFAMEREKLEHAAMSAHDGKRNAVEAAEELKLQIKAMTAEVEALEEARDSFEKALAQSQSGLEWTRKMAIVLEIDRGGLERSLIEIRALYSALLKDTQSWRERAGSLSQESSLAALETAVAGGGASPELLKALDEAREQYRRLENECRLVRDFFEKKFEAIRNTSGSAPQ